MTRLQAVGGLLADAILPPECLSCRAPAADHGALCAQCWPRLGQIGHPLCDRLGIPLPYGGDAPVVSAEALAEPPPFDRCRAVAAYTDLAGRLVHRLKYADQPDLARWMGRWMARAGADLLDDADLVVPVPLHRRRLWGRRYNQAAALSAVLAAEAGVAHDCLALVRTRRTRQQVGLTRSQRERNLNGAFGVVGKRRFHGRRVILVDDVYTTGATVRAATRAVLRAGASAVDVIVFARVVREDF